MKNFPLILLAAGKSSRMGMPKGLIPFNNKTLLEFQIESFISIGGENIIILFGDDFYKYQNDIPWINDSEKDWIHYKNAFVKTLLNPNPKLGQFSSLQIGFREVIQNKNFFGAIILPIDVPLLNPSLIKKLIQDFNPSLKVCQPTYHLRGGHPVLVASHWGEYLINLDVHNSRTRLDTQINLLTENEIRKINVSDEHIFLNINTPEDLKKITNS